MPGIELVRTVPSKLQVRYYRAGQKARATELAARLGAILKIETGPDNAVQVTSSKQLSDGIFEVWLPH